jgi:hypothetical protein
MSKSDENEWQKREDQGDGRIESSHLSKKSLLSREASANDRPQEEWDIDRIRRRYQELIGASPMPDKARCQYEALATAYHGLTEEQKIAFLLAEGFPLLSQHQKQAQSANQGTGRDGSYRDTEELPVLC